MKNWKIIGLGATCVVLLVLLVNQCMWNSFLWDRVVQRKDVQETFATPSESPQIVRLDRSEIPSEFVDRVEALEKLPHVYQRLSKEIKKREAGSNVQEIDAYLEEVLDFPWLKQDDLNIDVTKAKAILDREHESLDKVKDRILEYLAVLKRVPDSSKTPILCFLGPPGVGKTTLAKSIAEATGRKFVRISLGGVNDEHKIRGSLRVYIGAKPGEIVRALKEANTMNPVILLDEIDKISSRSPAFGDPSAALLEVLDPAQNKSFKDNYFDLGIDLSKVLFVATANTYDIAPALRDRMEIIELSSYTLEEKMKIGKSLLQNQRTEHGLKENELKISESALKKIIVEYTAEAGVRELDRVIAKLARKAVKEAAEGTSKSLSVTPELLEKYLGLPIVAPIKTLDKDKVGATQGLAWTEIGGTVMIFEAAIVNGHGDITMTGNLGDISQESVKNAFTVAKGLLADYNLKSDFFSDKEVHVNAPSGGRKDGPSAGIAITTVIVSAATKIPVNRTVAMTGEINLHGEVLPIGGLKEKLIAAHASGLKIAIIPEANKSDLAEVPETVKKELKIMPVKTISEVLKIALTSSK